MSESEMFYGEKAELIRVGRAVMLDSYWRLRWRAMAIRNGHADLVPIVQELPRDRWKWSGLGCGRNWNGPSRELLKRASGLGIVGAERTGL